MTHSISVQHITYRSIMSDCAPLLKNRYNPSLALVPALPRSNMQQKINIQKPTKTLDEKYQKMIDNLTNQIQYLTQPQVIMSYSNVT